MLAGECQTVKEIVVTRPLILAIALTHSFWREGGSGRQSLDNSAYYRILSYVNREKGGGVLVLTGGEPFLDPRAAELLLFAQKQRWLTSVDTWCTFQELPLLELLHQIRICLFSLEPAVHDRIVGKEGHLRRVLSFGKWLGENFAGEKILVFPVCRENIGEIESLLKWCRKHNFKANIFITPKHNPNALKPSVCRSLIRKLSLFSPEEFIADLPLLGLYGRPNLCPGGRIAIFIDVDGGVKPCPHFPHPLCWLTDDVLTAWQSLQAKVTELNQVCSRCPHFRLCGGGCLANKAKSGKDYCCPYEDGEVV